MARPRFVESVLAACPDEAARTAVESVLRLWHGQRVYISRSRPSCAEARAKAAARYVLLGTRRDTAVALLIARGVSARHARRLLKKAEGTHGATCVRTPCEDVNP